MVIISLEFYQILLALLIEIRKIFVITFTYFIEKSTIYRVFFLSYLKLEIKFVV